MIDRRLFKIPGIMPRIVLIAFLTLIQAVMIVIQARALAIAVVQLAIEAVGDDRDADPVFAVSFWPVIC